MRNFAKKHSLLIAKNLKVSCIKPCHKHGGLLPAQQLRLEDSNGTSWTGISHLQAAWKNLVSTMWYGAVLGL